MLGRYSTDFYFLQTLLLPGEWQSYFMSRCIDANHLLISNKLPAILCWNRELLCGMGEFEPSVRDNALHQNSDGAVGQVADPEDWNVSTKRWKKTE
jgi:hypothetical protein